MKIIILNIFLIFIVINISKADTDLGLSLGPVLRPSLINDKLLWLTGSRLGLTLDSKYYIGISLYGSTFDSYQPIVQDANYVLYPEMNINFISFEIEYNLSSESEIYPSFLLNNGVSLTKFDIPYSLEKDGNLYNPVYKENIINYFIEPGISVNFNFKSFYKVNIGLSYRYVFMEKTAIVDLQKDASQFYLDNSYLNGFDLSFAIRFGGF